MTEQNKKLGYFDNIKIFLKSSTESDGSQEIEVKYICDICHKLMTKEEMLNGNYNIPISGGTVPMYHQAKYRCKECDYKLIAERMTNHE